MNDWYEKSMRALQLGGMSPCTQNAYTRAVRQLVEFHDKTPDRIDETALQEYFLHRRNVDKWSPATLRIAYSGIKFFFLHVLERDWHIFAYLNAKKTRQLPCILSPEEVHCILNRVTTFHNYVFLSTVYACGLRLSEALNIPASKSAKSRSTPSGIATPPICWKPASTPESSSATAFSPTLSKRLRRRKSSCRIARSAAPSWN
jgi:site-specific recombinase XerD